MCLLLLILPPVGLEPSGGFYLTICYILLSSRTHVFLCRLWYNRAMNDLEFACGLFRIAVSHQVTEKEAATWKVEAEYDTGELDKLPRLFFTIAARNAGLKYAVSRAADEDTIARYVDGNFAALGLVASDMIDEMRKLLRAKHAA